MPKAKPSQGASDHANLVTESFEPNRAWPQLVITSNGFDDTSNGFDDTSNGCSRQPIISLLTQQFHPRVNYAAIVSRSRSGLSLVDPNSD